jgi:hypothetical protein
MLNRLLFALALVLGLASGAVAGTSTTTITLSPNVWTSIGAGPLKAVVKQMSGGTVNYLQQDTTPASDSLPDVTVFGVGGQSTFSNANAVWARSTDPVNPIQITVTTGLTPAGGSGGGSGSLPPNAAQEGGGNLATVANAQGAGATGVSQPAGGSGILGWLSGIYNAVTGLLSVSDSQSSPFQGAVPMTVGTAYTARRSVGASCTVPGNVSMAFVDASTIVVPVSVGWQTFPFAVTQINSSGTTATCAYTNLK